MSYLGPKVSGQLSDIEWDRLQEVRSFLQDNIKMSISFVNRVGVDASDVRFPNRIITEIKIGIPGMAQMKLSTAVDIIADSNEGILEQIKQSAKSQSFSWSTFARL